MKRPRLSPLRYPGGKSGLYPVLRSIIRASDLTSGTYVEPYAGGAGAALGLLFTGEVAEIVINDLDPAIYAFWRAAVDHNEDLCLKVRSTPVTVAEWHRQRKCYLTSERTDYLALGFATFFLNRTNRSGVLNGGPIGGHDQSGNYKIDARFNRETLVERLRLIGLYGRHIKVTGLDGTAIIEQYKDIRSAFIYADPPYFEKAGSLYMNSFKWNDHATLAAMLNSASDSNWVLTYDDVPEVVKLYPLRTRTSIPLYYSAHRVVKTTEIMVYSDAIAQI